MFTAQNDYTIPHIMVGLAAVVLTGSITHRSLCVVVLYINIIVTLMVHNDRLTVPGEARSSSLLLARL